MIYSRKPGVHRLLCVASILLPCAGAVVRAQEVQQEAAKILVRAEELVLNPLENLVTLEMRVDVRLDREGVPFTASILFEPRFDFSMGPRKGHQHRQGWFVTEPETQDLSKAMRREIMECARSYIVPLFPIPPFGQWAAQVEEIAEDGRELKFKGRLPTGSSWLPQDLSDARLRLDDSGLPETLEFETSVGGSHSLWYRWKKAARTGRYRLALLGEEIAPSGTQPARTRVFKMATTDVRGREFPSLALLRVDARSGWSADFQYSGWDFRESKTLEPEQKGVPTEARVLLTTLETRLYRLATKTSRLTVKGSFDAERSTAAEKPIGIKALFRASLVFASENTTGNQLERLELLPAPGELPLSQEARQALQNELPWLLGSIFDPVSGIEGAYERVIHQKTEDGNTVVETLDPVNQRRVSFGLDLTGRLLWQTAEDRSGALRVWDFSWDRAPQTKEWRILGFRTTRSGEPDRQSTSWQIGYREEGVRSVPASAEVKTLGSDGRPLSLIRFQFDRYEFGE